MSSLTEGKKNPRASKKINGYCTCFVRKVSKGSEIVVTYCSEHVNHDIDLRHLPISKMMRTKVVRELQAGASTQEILKKINELAGTNSRDCMLNGADISNIRYSLLNNKRTKIDFGLLEKYQEMSNVEENDGLDVGFIGDTDIISSPESLDKAREHFFVQHRKLFDFIHKCTNAKTIDHITEKIIRLMN